MSGYRRKYEKRKKLQRQSKLKKDQRAPAKKGRKGGRALAQEGKEKKQLAEGYAKKQTSRKRRRDQATASSVCRKLPMQDQLVNEEEEQCTNTFDSTSCPKCQTTSCMIPRL